MFEVRKCLNPGCLLRYSTPSGSEKGIRCPLCRSETVVLLADQDQLAVPVSSEDLSSVHLEVMLDNIRSAWNVGSMFRAADGAGVACVHICGVSATPEHPGVKKTSLGAEKALPWRYHPDGLEAARALKLSGNHLWALEGGPRAEPLAEAVEAIVGPLVLVVGNEVSGVDPGILDVCERVVYLPMRGMKRSLNVATAFGIAVYWLRYNKNG